MSILLQIVRVIAIDDDKGDNGLVTYSITNPIDCDNCFRVDATTGWISINSAIPDNVSWPQATLEWC